MKVEIEVPELPEGYTEVYYGIPQKGELILQTGNKWKLAEWDYDTVWIVARKPKQYREPVLPADFGKECEYSTDGVNWEKGILKGWSKHAIETNVWLVQDGNRAYRYHARIEVT